MITKSYGKRLKKLLEEKPLKEGEFQRVEGLGGQFVALALTEVTNGYQETFSFSFNQVEYKLYSKLGDQR